VLLIDHTKVARRAIHRICDLVVFDAVVVDAGIDPEERQRLEDGGANLVIAELSSQATPLAEVSPS
jgi:DeoR/GlpR family transcriptional regulator of sugar metabolism